MLKQLQSQSYYRNPFPVIADMRSRGALVKTKIPILGEVWLTTTQSATARILKNSSQFTVRKADGRVAGMSWWMPRTIQRLTANMLSMDEPEHTRLRRIVDHVFQRKMIMAMEKQIKRLADEQLALILRKGEEVDLVSNFARPFPLAVICELLGLPDEDRGKFMNWAAGITTVRGVISFLFAIRGLRPLTVYIENRIEFERVHGGQGLIHELIHETDESLSDDELVSMIFLLLLAGHETTTHLISGGMLALLEHPEQLAILEKSDGNLDLAVEELLRFVSPVQTTKPRYVREDCMIEGIELKAGELIMPFLAAANADPEVFDEPDKLNVTRRPNRHMAFGSGPHFCLGNQLARLELKIAIKALLLSNRPIVVAQDGQNLRWVERFGLRSLERLPVRFGPQRP